MKLIKLEKAKKIQNERISIDVQTRHMKEHKKLVIFWPEDGFGGGIYLDDKIYQKAKAFILNELEAREETLFTELKNL